MTNPTQEIEVKACIDNFTNVLERLERLGCHFSEPIHQKDDVFFQNGITAKDLKKGSLGMRLREQDGQIIFTMKQRQNVELSVIEKELTISDKKTMGEILIFLGFYKSLSINKTRRKTRFKDMEICLDEVEELGNYIEVEKMSSEDGEKVQEELYQFLESIGIPRDHREPRGYDTIMYDKKNPTK